MNSKNEHITHLKTAGSSEPFFVESVEANDVGMLDADTLQKGKALVEAFHDKSDSERLRQLVNAGAPVNYRLDYGLEVKLESDFVASFSLLLEGDKGEEQLTGNAKKLFDDVGHALYLANYLRTGQEFFDILHSMSANNEVIKINPDFAKFLEDNAVESRANPEHQNGSLIIAAGIRDPELLEKIIAAGEMAVATDKNLNGAAINFRGFFGDNAAVWSAILLDEPALKLLLEKGSDINDIGITSSSLLHWVAVASRLDENMERKSKALSIAKLLLSHGASLLVENTFQLTPVDYARGELLEFFEEHLANEKASAPGF